MNQRSILLPSIVIGFWVGGACSKPETSPAPTPSDGGGEAAVAAATQAEGLPAPSSADVFGENAVAARARLVRPDGTGLPDAEFQVGTLCEGMAFEQVPWAAVRTDNVGRFEFPIADWIAPREVEVRFLFRAPGPTGPMTFAESRPGPLVAGPAGHVDLGDFRVELP